MKIQECPKQNLTVDFTLTQNLQGHARTRADIVHVRERIDQVLQLKNNNNKINNLKSLFYNFLKKGVKIGSAILRIIKSKYWGKIELITSFVIIILSVYEIYNVNDWLKSTFKLNLIIQFLS